MNRKVKRYDPINSDGTCGMCIEDADFGAYVEYEDCVALEAECDSLWSTYVALVDKLGIDTEKAKTADGKPSDVIVSYVDALRAENERLRAGTQMLREAVSALANIAHEHRHELMQQRFSDNDEGDAFARHRDSRVGRIDRILQAALTASRTGQEQKDDDHEL